MSPRRLAPLLLVMTLLAAGDALAQDKGSINPKPLPPLANPNDPSIGAKELFARKLLPSKGPAHVIGSYVKGCIGGAEQMPLNGDNWQVMRLSRNRSYGHPAMIALISGLPPGRTRTRDGRASWSATSPSRAAGRPCRAMPATRSASMPTSG